MPISWKRPQGRQGRRSAKSRWIFRSERIRACLAAVKAAGKPLMIGFNRRFDPNFAALKARMPGVIGKTELVTIISRDPGPPPISYIETSGGLFRDMMIHDLDMARFLLGEEPVEVHAVASSLVDPAIGKAGDVDTAAVLLKTASGKIAQISNSRRATYGYDQRIEVHGSKGMIRARQHPRTTVEVATGAGFLPIPCRTSSSNAMRKPTGWKWPLSSTPCCLAKAPDPSAKTA